LNPLGSLPAFFLRKLEYLVKIRQQFANISYPHILTPYHDEHDLIIGCGHLPQFLHGYGEYTYHHQGQYTINRDPSFLRKKAGKEPFHFNWFFAN